MTAIIWKGGKVDTHFTLPSDTKTDPSCTLILLMETHSSKAGVNEVVPSHTKSALIINMRKENNPKRKYRQRINYLQRNIRQMGKYPKSTKKSNYNTGNTFPF